MFANHGRARQLHLSITHYRFVALILPLLLAATIAQGQNAFSSGSTGVDGAFAPTTTQTIVVPDSGIFNFTTVNIPAGITITFSRGTNNRPLTLLANGDVVIAGTINVDGKPGNPNGTGGAGGPGGFNGGSGGYGFDQSFSGVSGEGPGGGGGGTGNATNGSPGSGGGGGYGSAGTVGSGTVAGPAGPKSGTVTILPLIGGSGGGGGGALSNGRGGAGGGGGGAILIASSGAIIVNGAILARGGSGLSATAPGGGAAGGAIRLIANTITGTGSLNVSGGSGACFGSCAGFGGQGYVRLEAYDTNSFAGLTTPSNIASLSFPQPIAQSNSPALRIASVGGVNSPTSPTGSLQSPPDVIVPATQTNPVTVALEATNIPLGTIIQLILTPSRGARTIVQSSALAGTESASTANASLNLPAGISIISALAVIDLTIATGSPIFMEGERVNRIEVAATFARALELTYVTESGRRLKQSTK